MRHRHLGFILMVILRARRDVILSACAVADYMSPGPDSGRAHGLKEWVSLYFDLWCMSS